MPPYEKQLLEKTAKLSEENHKILERLQSSARWARFFSILKWTVILGLAIGAYYYIQPYLEAVVAAYNSIEGATGGINIDIPLTDRFKEIFGSIFNL